MSGEVTTKKRKGKGKKKAMLEALQQEEYRNEREHIRLLDDEEEFMYQPPPRHYDEDDTTNDMAHLMEDESSGSGCCAKLLFFLLITAFGVAAGVVFFELGGTNGPLADLPSLPNMPDFANLPNLPDLSSLPNIPSFSDIEKYINDIKAPWFDSETPTPETPVEQPQQQESVDEFIEPSPTEPDFELPVEEEPVIYEAAQIVQSPPEEILEVTTDAPEIATEPTVFEEPEVVSQEPESHLEQQEPIKGIVETPAGESIETPVEESIETPVEESIETPVEESIETPVEESIETPVEESIETLVEESIETLVEESIEIPVEESIETPVEESIETPVEESIETLVGENVENPVGENTETPVTESIETPVGENVENPVGENAETPVTESIEAPVEEISHFEQRLEDDTPEVPQESYTIRAEREAVQEAVDNVWVLTVRCIEELRALQTMAKASQTLHSVAEISSRLEPLRLDLNDLATSTSASQFDGALERAADLERRLRAVLDALDEARKLDDIIAAAIEQEQEKAADQQDHDESVQEAEEIAAEEPQTEEVPLQVEIVEEAIEQISQEPTPTVEIVEHSEASARNEQIEQVADIAPTTEEVNEQSEQPLAAPVAQEEPLVVEIVEQVDAVPKRVESIPAPVVEEVVQHPTESPQAIYTESPVEPEESEPVDEPVQVAKEAFIVEPARETSAPAPEVPSYAQNLEETDRLVDQSPGEALKLMEQILEVAPTNALALYGRARSLDTLAELERSNARLEQAIFAYRAVLDLEELVGDDLYRKAALRCIDRMRFRGFHGKAIRIQQRMVARFPDDVDLRNQLAVSFLITNQAEAAKTILEDVLKKWPNSGFAQVHLGFILKTAYDDYEAGARWMRSGIDTRDDGVTDGRFYFHLGDALTRLGRREEAQQVFIEGEQVGVFLSRDQRSLYNVDRLTGKPWWDKESTTYKPFFDLLEANWQAIRDEGVALLDLNPPEGFADESEKLKNTGDWKQFELFVQGRKNAEHCKRAPKTCTLIENYPPALCKRGQVKFSVMHPGTHVWPHTGPTNCRIRAHLGLVVPEGLALRVANETRTWEEGKFIVFDDSFEHEVWHSGSSYRLVLIVDLWHPELTPEERKSLPAI